jgi:hypothetical protein
MQGSPVINNSNGDLVNALDSVLVNGFNTLSVTSIVMQGPLSAVVTATSHGMQINQVVELIGASDDAYVGQFRVTSTSTTNLFTVTLVANPAGMLAATGTLTMKTPGLGFTIAFSGTNKRVYRSSDIAGTQQYLRVDDALDANYSSAYGKYAKVGVADTMTDIDTFTGNQMPFDIISPTKNWVSSGSGATVVNGWYKWYYSWLAWNSGSNTTESLGNQTSAKQWTIIGDSRGFYLMNEFQQNIGKGGYCFTDFISFKGSDKYNSILCATERYAAANANIGAYNQTDSGCWMHTLKATGSGKIVMKDYTNTGLPIQVSFQSIDTLAFNPGTLWPISGYQTNVTFPSKIDNNFMIADLFISENTSGFIRGKMPGIKYMIGNINTSIPEHMQWYGNDGRLYMNVQPAVGQSASGTNNYIARANMAFDLTGPWY